MSANFLYDLIEKIPEQGVNTPHTFESFISKAVGAHLHVTGDPNVDYVNGQAMKMIKQELAKMGLTEEMCTRVLADGKLERHEAIEMIGSMGNSMKAITDGMIERGKALGLGSDYLPTLGTAQALANSKELASRYGITDQSVIRGVAYFEDAAKHMSQTVDAGVGRMLGIPGAKSGDSPGGLVEAAGASIGAAAAGGASVLGDAARVLTDRASAAKEPNDPFVTHAPVIPGIVYK